LGAGGNFRGIFLGKNVQKIGPWGHYYDFGNLFGPTYLKGGTCEPQKIFSPKNGKNIWRVLLKMKSFFRKFI
jgi:hypothetical protein